MERYTVSHTIILPLTLTYRYILLYLSVYVTLFIGIHDCLQVYLSDRQDTKSRKEQLASHPRYSKTFQVHDALHSHIQPEYDNMLNSNYGREDKLQWSKLQGKLQENCHKLPYAFRNAAGSLGTSLTDIHTNLYSTGGGGDNTGVGERSSVRGSGINQSNMADLLSMRNRNSYNGAGNNNNQMESMAFAEVNERGRGKGEGG